MLKQGIPFIPVSARPPYAITPYTEQLWGTTWYDLLQRRINFR
ncbi:HAD family hydrolase [Aggregatibacter segnis ATCC 33393]|uniref:HAD family hydrolase n=1 Tax=Aggregatibacter segnis ATCC 33393 TaxID=888057 RepID=E6KZV5_9PAST|nr:HAD family hydrolase [Aggregatibacter segnis ATCC 33393]